MLVAARGALAVLLSATLGACSAEDSASSGGGAAGGAAAGRGASGPISAVCTVDDAIDPAIREALQTRALAVHRALREGDDEALWDQLHPQARRDDQREAYLSALGSMRSRLAPAPGEPRVERTGRVDLSGGANALARVECGAEDDPDRFTLLTNAGGEDVAVVWLRSGPAAQALATTVQLRRRGEQWRLVGIHVSPLTYRGKDAAAYEQMADVHMSQQRVVVAHLLLGLTRILSDRGASVKTPRHERVSQKLAAIERDQLFAAETGTWTLGDAHFRIQALSLVPTVSDISPVFEYISPQGLVADLLDRDADLLVAEVRRRFPELSQHFDAVVFEAYAEVPDEPGQSYQAFRVVRYLDPSRQRQ